MVLTMEEMINGLFELFAAYGVALNATDAITITASLLLFLAANPISKLLNDDSNLAARVSMMRALNFLIIIAIIAKSVFFSENIVAAGAAQSLIVIYFAVLVSQIINYFIRRRFGKPQSYKDKTIYSDTYSTRGLSLIVSISVGVVAIVSCLRLVGLDSLLEAGGALGIIGLVLAMTQASWAPDIISGLIILNSRFCEDGDVISFNMDGKTIIASIFKTKFFHTECLDMANNHRIMLRNAKLRDAGVQNLSRFASAKGLREVVYLNIDYKHSEDEVTSMVERAFVSLDESESMREEQHQPEVRVQETGDYAVTWAVYYYTKQVRKIISVRQTVRAYILAEANRSGISLSTPILQTASVLLGSTESTSDQEQLEPRKQHQRENQGS